MIFQLDRKEETVYLELPGQEYSPIQPKEDSLNLVQEALQSQLESHPPHSLKQNDEQEKHFKNIVFKYLWTNKASD